MEREAAPELLWPLRMLTGGDCVSELGANDAYWLKGYDQHGSSNSGGMLCDGSRAGHVRPRLGPEMERSRSPSARAEDRTLELRSALRADVLCLRGRVAALSPLSSLRHPLHSSRGRRTSFEVEATQFFGCVA